MNRSLKLAAVAMAAVLCGAACTTNPYTGERKAGNVGKGAGIGAAVGAAAGLLTKGDKLENALIGAGIGAIAGGGVGYYMDVQETKLRQKLEGTGVSVTRAGDNITLNLPGNVTFASNSADLNSRFFEVLDSVGLVLKEYDKTVVEVAGHTDNTGTKQLNQGLSERRAGTVANYLSGRGIKSQRFITVGAADTHPIASNATAEGKQQNRRVEITIVPNRA
ncbi:MAG: OmpA family protein [Candidatus Obscuribacterales bacterium]|nr:OmpA family protein [Steroidobacteraceae bacterium]